MNNEAPVYQIIVKKKKHIFLKAILILIIIGLFFILAVEAALFFYLKGVYNDVEDDFNTLIQNLSTPNSQTLVMDVNGENIATLNSDEKRRIIKISEMSDYLPKAYISIEDERFYEHFGVDLKRTTEAIYTYLRNDGYSGFGGSTITQQLVKNVSGNNEKRVERKIREWVMAYRLEQYLTKDEILEQYLNIIFVGSDIYGVELGSKYYFNKSAKDLSLAESAFLAGITNEPNNYNPFDESTDNSKKIIDKTKVVLNKMLSLNNITQKEYSDAVNEVEQGLKFERTIIGNEINSYHTDAAINQIIQEIAEKKNMSIPFATNYVYSKGLVIYTTQDTNIQTQVEEEFKKTEHVRSSLKIEGDTTQATMVIIDQKTGFVLACVGELGEKTTNMGLNRATQSTRQTGSAMKPIAVLGPALQEGIITPISKYNDVRTTFILSNGEKYTPKDFGYSRGNITVRQAVETSQNIPFVKMMEELTPSKSKEYLIKMGITSLTENDCSLALAIGGLNKGISTLEMAAAYATIANEGTYIEPTFYTKVNDYNGNNILEAEQRVEQVFSKQVAFILKDLLKQPVEGRSGTARNCAIEGMDVAAKTGTTNDHYDRWLCGFTPYYTAACWYGYDYNEEVLNSGNPASNIWINVMKNLHSSLESARFIMPDGVETAKVYKSSGQLANKYASSSYTYTEYFVEGTIPNK